MQRFLLTLLAAVTSVASALALGRGVGTIPDPYASLQNVVTQCTNASGRTYSGNGQTVDTTKKNLVMLVFGQSNAGANNSTAYSPTNGSKLDNLSPYDGAIYVAADPLIGSCGDFPLSLGPGSWSFVLADLLVSASLFDRVIVVPFGWSGQTAASLDTTPGICCRWPGIFARLGYRGITPTTTGVTMVVLYEQGESDGATSQASYVASVNDIILQSRNAGFTQGNVPWFIAEATWVNGANATIQAAQTATAPSGLINHSANIWAGALADSLDNTNRQDNVHFNVTGRNANAALWKTALHAFGAPF